MAARGCRLRQPAASHWISLGSLARGQARKRAGLAGSPHFLAPARLPKACGFTATGRRNSARTLVHRDRFHSRAWPPASPRSCGLRARLPVPSRRRDGARDGQALGDRGGCALGRAGPRHRYPSRGRVDTGATAGAGGRDLRRALPHPDRAALANRARHRNPLAHQPDPQRTASIRCLGTRGHSLADRSRTMPGISGAIRQQVPGRGVV